MFGYLERYVCDINTRICVTLMVMLSVVISFCQWFLFFHVGGSVAEWLACLTQAQKGPGSNCSRDAVG